MLVLHQSLDDQVEFLLYIPVHFLRLKYQNKWIVYCDAANLINQLNQAFHIDHRITVDMNIHQILDGFNGQFCSTLSISRIQLSLDSFSILRNIGARYPVPNS